MLLKRSIERGVPENFPLANRSAESLDVFTIQEGKFAGTSLQRLVVGGDDPEALRNLDSFIRNTVPGGFSDPMHNLMLQDALRILQPAAEWNDAIELAWAQLSLAVNEAGFSAFSAKAKAVTEHLADNPGKFFTVFSVFEGSDKPRDRAAHIDGFGMFGVQERYDHPEYVGFEPVTRDNGRQQYLPEGVVMRGLFAKIS